MHVLRQSPHKKLYDTTAHRFITPQAVRCLADCGEELHVVDGRTGRDVTQRVLPHLLGTDAVAHRFSGWLARALEAIRASVRFLACAVRLMRAGQWAELGRRVRVLLARDAAPRRQLARPAPRRRRRRLHA